MVGGRPRHEVLLVIRRLRVGLAAVVSSYKPTGAGAAYDRISRSFVNNVYTTFQQPTDDRPHTQTRDSIAHGLISWIGIFIYFYFIYAP